MSEPANQMVTSGSEVAQLRALARLLDEAIGVPGTRLRFGLDPIIGLIPGFGDLLGGGLSLLVLVRASRLGAPSSVLTRMAGNILFDTALGSIPLLGDLFDAGFKSNVRNVDLLEQHLLRPQETKRASALIVLGLILAVLLALGGAAFLAVWLIRRIAGAL